MPLQEFWNDDPDLLWTYRNSYIEKKKLEIETQREMINFQGWIYGLYNFNAIAGALSKKTKYLDEPIDLYAKPKSEKERKLEVAQKVKENMKRGQALLKRRKD